jgi:hypothetical protein
MLFAVFEASVVSQEHDADAVSCAGYDPAPMQRDVKVSHYW